MAVQTVQMAVKVRSEMGSRANKRLRDGGEVPGVIYGKKEKVTPITLARRELVQHLALGTHVFTLSVEGSSENVLVKDVQYDHLGKHVIHVDFARVSLDERVQVTVPIELKGTPNGEAEGGVLQQILAELEIECLVLEIPDAIRHSVADMELDSVLHVSDLKLPPGVKAMQDDELIVATVREVQEAVTAAVAEEGAAEPEVIGRKAAEEAEAGEAPGKE
jgi:large subunit ribosomal protein L25